MRNLDGSLIGDLNDRLQAISSTDVSSIPTSSLNENLTEYDLFPVRLNHVPIVTRTISDGSEPAIKSISLVDGQGRDLFRNQDGVVRVLIGSTFTLNFLAEQPNILNVENGVPELIPNQQQLTYTWRLNDEQVSTRDHLTVTGNSLTVNDIRPRFAGSYLCEVSNDIGTVASEIVDIEVYDPESDQLMFNNLVQNSSAKDDVDFWNSNNNDFTTKDLSSIDLKLLKTPHRVDLFGYTADMMHPRPYQIDSGVLRNSDLSKDLLKNGKYFSRSPYQFTSRGGSTYVKAYQDIDLTDLTDVIRGGVLGVEGVRAVFGCYIGNAVSNYKPAVHNLARDRRLNRRGYYAGAPRLGVENVVQAGPPTFLDRAFVTIEEFDNETRLRSNLLSEDGDPVLLQEVATIQDPWAANREYNTEPYYDHLVDDPLELGFSSQGSAIDSDLRVADRLMPDLEERFTYGQYVEFNKLVLDKLNPATNKIRITIHFLCDDGRLIETNRLFTDVGSDEIFDFALWEHPHERNSFHDTGFGTKTIWQQINDPDADDLLDEPAERKYFLQPDPRPMVTGVSLGLLPVLVNNPEETELHTNGIFAVNTLPSSTTPNVLEPIPFDPFERNRLDMEITFKHVSPFLTGANLQEMQLLGNSRTTLTAITPQSGTFQATDAYGFYPFTEYHEVDMNTAGYPVSSLETTQLRVLAARYGEGVVTDDPEISYITNVANSLSAQSNWVATPPSSSYSGSLADVDGSFGSPHPYLGKVRYVLYYSRRMQGYQPDTYADQQLAQNPGVATYLSDSIPFNSYVLEMDFTGEQSVFTLSRESTLPGTGSLEPVVLDHGLTPEGGMYFDLPQQVVLAPREQGGLGLPTRSVRGFEDIEVTRANGTPVTTLISRRLQWRELGEVYGEDIQRQVIASVFPGVEEDAGFIPYTERREAVLQQARSTMFEVLSEVNNVFGFQGTDVENPVDQADIDNLLELYRQLYGDTGLQIRGLELYGRDAHVEGELDWYSLVSNFNMTLEDRALYDQIGVLQRDQPVADLWLGSIIPPFVNTVRSTTVDISPSYYSANGDSMFSFDPNRALLGLVRQGVLGLTGITVLSDTVTHEVQDPNYATSLYLVQAAPFDGVTQAGTPTYGFDSEGKYYYIRHTEIHDQQIDGGIRS